MFCSSCGTNVEGQFCPKCGLAVGGVAVPPAPDGVSVNLPEEVGLRCAAYLIDVIPAVIVGFMLGWIPIIGAIILGFILLAYWLLRDIAGGSLGKLVLGLKVVKKDGSESGPKERQLRNVTLAIGPSMLIIPFAGYAIAPVVAGLIILTETVLLLAKKERLGDMLAGTTVVKKSAITRAPSA